MLLLLSSYIQLLQLYDTIFRHVYDSFRDMPRHVLGSCSGQAQFKFHVIDLSFIDDHLHVKILIQVIEHHIDSLETLVGLSVEFRLSRQTKSASGILSNMNLTELVQIVMTQSEDCLEGSGRTLVTSLRDGIRKVKGLL